MAVEKEYIDIFQKYRKEIDQNSASVLNEKREQYFELFQQLGFPKPDSEAYKYTDLRESLSKNYALNILSQNSAFNPYEAFSCDVPNIDVQLYYMFNEKFYVSSEPNKEALPEGVIVESLKVAAKKYPDLVRKYYGKLSDKQNDGLIALNGAFSQDGFFIYVPCNVQLEKPIQLVNVLKYDTDLMVNSRNLIVVEAGAKVQLLICDHTMSHSAFFANRVSEVFVGENSQYEHYYLENVHKDTTTISTLLSKQEASSNVLGNLITLQNGVTRNTVQMDLDGENCETTLCGMLIADKNQMIDNHTTILHNKAHCRSTELFKHVLNENSRGGFTGRLCVAKDAQKTEAYQTNKNILMASTAKALTRQQLEIFADDVKCSHGATIGQLDDEALFYMEARGIPRHEAMMLLMNAFTADVVDKIRIDVLRKRITQLIEKRLRGELSFCESCSLNE